MMTARFSDSQPNPDRTGSSLAQMALDEGQQQARVAAEQDESVVLWFAEAQVEMLREVANILELSTAATVEAAISHVHYKTHQINVWTKAAILNDDVNLTHPKQNGASSDRAKSLKLPSLSRKIRNKLEDLEVGDDLSAFVAIAIQLLHRQLTQPQPLKPEDD